MLIAGTNAHWGTQKTDLNPQKGPNTRRPSTSPPRGRPGESIARSSRARASTQQSSISSMAPARSGRSLGQARYVALAALLAALACPLVAGQTCTGGGNPAAWTLPPGFSLQSYWGATGDESRRPAGHRGISACICAPLAALELGQGQQQGAFREGRKPSTGLIKRPPFSPLRWQGQVGPQPGGVRQLQGHGPGHHLRVCDDVWQRAPDHQRPRRHDRPRRG